VARPGSERFVQRRAPDPESVGEEPHRVGMKCRPSTSPPVPTRPPGRHTHDDAVADVSNHADVMRNQHDHRLRRCCSRQRGAPALHMTSSAVTGSSRSRASGERSRARMPTAGHAAELMRKVVLAGGDRADDAKNSADTRPTSRLVAAAFDQHLLDLAKTRRPDRARSWRSAG